MVNLSLFEGSFPSHFKSAIVFSLLKKPTLNKHEQLPASSQSQLAFQGPGESFGEPIKFTHKQYKHIQLLSVCI